MRLAACAIGRLAAMMLFIGIISAPALAAPGPSFETLAAEARAAMLNDPHVTAVKAIEAGAVAARQPPSRARAIQQATALWLHGEALMRLNDLGSAKPLIEQAVQISARSAPDSQLLGDALLARGWINSVQANVAQALDDYQRAHAIYVKLGDLRSQSKALQSIGTIYGGGNDHQNALKYYNQALSLVRSDAGLAVSLRNNRGNSLKDLGQYQKAEAEYQQALTISRPLNSPVLKLTILANIAETRLLAKDVAGAQRAITEALALTTRGEAAGYRKPLIALAAQAAFQRHDLLDAKRLIGERFAGENFADSTLIDREAHRTAYTIYLATGDHDLALRHLVVLKRLDDEATTLARSTNAALMAARFDFANQELRIASLQRDEARRNVAYEQARARTQRNVFLGIVGSSIVAILMLGFGLITLQRSRDKVRAANADLAVTNAALGRALAAKTEFLATTSHEIRTPLNGILGMTQVMLADRQVDGAIRERLSVVHGAGMTMRALVDDILDVAKMETGHLVIEEAPFDLCAMMRESSRLWEDQAAAKGLSFQRDLNDCPGLIVGDATRMRQIVFNLMSNALKFTATGSVTLSARAVSDDRLQFVVADTGVGIAPDKQEEIFESFRQADTSTTRQFGGTGLGLAICRNIARAMGGDVTVTSVAGEGSRFTVDLPLVHAAPVIPMPSQGGCKGDLLIVDANPITRSMLRTLMTAQLGVVAVAASIEEAISLMDGNGFDRLLIDSAVLTNRDAADAASLRLLSAATSATITVLWPAGSDPDHFGFETREGLVNVIKPVTGTSLVASVCRNRHVMLVTQAA